MLIELRRYLLRLVPRTVRRPLYSLYRKLALEEVEGTDTRLTRFACDTVSWALEMLEDADIGDLHILDDQAALTEALAMSEEAFDGMMLRG